MNEMKSILITLSSFALTFCVIMNAYYQKKQFYPSVVYITKSSPSMAVLYLQAFILVIIAGKMMRRIFFGQLRAAETEHLIERSWYAITETCLAFTVFRDDFSPRFVALFTVLLFLKCFHWLAEDRIDYMERSPVISLLFHIRAVSLLALLGLLDFYFISHAYQNTLIKGPSVQLVFGFEYAILLTAVTHVFVKYVLHAIDLQRDNPWENKALYLLYAELVLSGVKVLFYILFLSIMIRVHTFPLFVIRPMYLTIREFKKALNDVVMSRRAIRNMNTLYPNATAEELASGDNVCIICREEMHTACKKLPCNHIFHTSCLRSWFQRQQTCPTCRMDVLRSPATVAGVQMPQAQQPRPAPAPIPPPMFPGGYPPWMPNFLPPMPPQMMNNPVTTVASTGATSSVPPVMNFPMPLFAFPPVPAQNFNPMSAEQLQRMRGTELQNVRARMQCLQDIQTLLNAAVAHLQQYAAVVGELPIPQNPANSPSTNGFTSEAAANDYAQGGEARSSGMQDDELLEGAVGYSVPGNNVAADVESNTGMNEVRKRRIERFDAQAE